LILGVKTFTSNLDPRTWFLQVIPVEARRHPSSGSAADSAVTGQALSLLAKLQIHPLPSAKS